MGAIFRPLTSKKTAHFQPSSSSAMQQRSFLPLAAIQNSVAVIQPIISLESESFCPL
jgi:hypothetical protein